MPDTPAHIDIERPPLISLNPDERQQLEADDRVANAQLLPPAHDSEQAPGLRSPAHALVDVDAVDVDWPVHVKLEHDDEPEVIDVSDIQASSDNAWPLPKTEPRSPQHEDTVEPDGHVADAPVKEEIPVLRHGIDNRVAILQNENGEDVLREVLQQESKLKRPAELKTLVERLNPKFPVSFEEYMLRTLEQQGSRAPDRDVWQIRADITRAAKDLLNLSAEERATHMEAVMSAVETPGKGRGVMANRDIAAFEILGPYAGKWLDSDGQSREKARVGEDKLHSYAFNVPNKKVTISAFGDGHGNLTSLLNDADNPAANNVSHMWLGKNLVFLVAKRPIPQGEQLLLNYGEAYDRSGWESHPIKVEDDEQGAVQGK